MTGVLNFLVLQWFGVRLARVAYLLRQPGTEKVRCRCIFCGERVLYDPDLSVNLNNLAGCADGGLHVGEVGESEPSETRYRWSLLRWVWPLTGWWSNYRWIDRRR